MENNTNKKNIANTMEIDSIIKEARTYRMNGEQNAAQAENELQDISNAQFEDAFVIYDEEKQTKKQKKEKKPLDPKKKKKAILISVIAGVAVLLCIAGFCIYSVLTEFTYPDYVYVNDVALGGLTKSEAKQLLETEEQKMSDNINIVVEAQDKNTVLKKDNLTYTFTTDEVLEQAHDFVKENTFNTKEQKFTLAIKIDNNSLDEVVSGVAGAINQEPKDAVVTKFDSSKKGKDRFVFEDSAVGIELNKEEFKKQLLDFTEEGKVSGVIDASHTKVEPKYSKEFLLSSIKKLSSFTTTSTNSANGNHNMKLSLSQCNNSIINPGETWSFNKCTGNSNLTSNGYKPAGVIVEGRSETGIGGGICQSSTTIYNATMLCGMEVVERDCHYYKSVYVDAGRDATVDYGNIDLKVKNVFDYQLFMECYMDGTVLHCNMYGIENPEFDEIKIDSSITSYFSRGYRAQTTRTFYLDGKKVKTENLPNSTYYTSAPSSSSGSSSKKSSKPTSKPADDTDTGNTSQPSGDTGTDSGTTSTPDPGTDSGGGSDVIPDPDPGATPDPGSGESGGTPGSGDANAASE